MGLFTSVNTRHLKKIEKIVQKIENKAEYYKSLNDSELQNVTPKLKERLKQGETLDDILPDAYALVREASTRVLGLRHFHVQLIGGVVLHQGRIAEMKTGEGKTLVATLPAYLNALSGNNVHVVTVNEFLAKNQAEIMGKLYKFLGLTVGVTLSGQQPQEKKRAYEADITYGTNNEFGFDYLRDNMQPDKKYKVQRGLKFAIVDEVDSILIDEARTPLIISGRGGKTSELYVKADSFVKRLTDQDYEIDIKQKQIRLTEQGVSRAEKYFGIENLSDITALELNHHINNALRANYIMKKDINYIVKDDEILIVDEFTGRVMSGRRYSDGLHQAIEAKEHVKIKDENKTLATITFQNYFKSYRKLSGMTGTAKTEETEFNKIYSLDVVVIPTNKPIQRIDEQDMVFYTEKAKLKAIVAEIKEKHDRHQPILVGTASVEKSEEISKAISKEGIRHNVLNAKNHELESMIVAQAGRLNAVTISTNMAGRGTDIMLGGNAEYLTKNELRLEGIDSDLIERATTYGATLNDEEKAVLEKYNNLYKKFKEQCDKEKEEVIKVGGLHILGTERHESRRIDNQLRGRAGRQGDVGSSIFFISLEDDLPQRFGEDRFKKWFSIIFKNNEDMPIQAKILTKFFESAQKRTEAHNFAIRKQVLQYDDVLNKQRQIIYAERDKVLDGTNIHSQVVDMIKEYVSRICYAYIDETKASFEWDLESLNKALEDKLIEKGKNLVTPELVEDCDLQEAQEKISKIVADMYEKKIEEFKKLGVDFSPVERGIMLTIVDKFWMDHIDAMNTLRNEIGILAYGQKDPIVAYKSEGFDMFDKMIDNIREYTASTLFRAKLQINVQMPARAPIPTNSKPAINSQAKNNTTNGGNYTNQKDSEVIDKYPGTERNAPCPCGSGKKYKNCCYRQ